MPAIYSIFKPLISRLFIALLAIAMVMAIQVNDAQANAAKCANLSSQLNSLAGKSTGNYKKYDAAAERQSTQIWYIKRDIRRAGCRGSTSGNCRALNNTLRKMQSNYRKLINQRNRYKNGTSSKRRSIRAKMAALQCNSQQNKNDRKKLIVKHSQPRQKFNIQPSSIGRYRTMCVRTCDGYYFPVSHSSKRSDFARDQRICNALCPASESRLFVHRNDGQESEAMVSVRGEAYTALPTAFKYRKQARNPSCSCGAANPTAAGLSTHTSLKIEKKAETKDDSTLKKMPLPLKRPEIYADFETQAHAASNLSPSTIKAFLSKNTGTQMHDIAQERKIRVVGSKFLPALEEAIDLRAPVPTHVQ